MVKIATLAIVTAMIATTGSAGAQSFNGGGSGTVAVPNGLSGPGGTMTFSHEPAVQGGGDLGVGMGTGRAGRGAHPRFRNPVLDRPGVQSDQRR